MVRIWWDVLEIFPAQVAVGILEHWLDPGFANNILGFSYYLFYSVCFKSIFESRMEALKKGGRFSEIIFQDKIFFGLGKIKSISFRKVASNAFRRNAHEDASNGIEFNVNS